MDFHKIAARVAILLQPKGGEPDVTIRLDPKTGKYEFTTDFVDEDDKEIILDVDGIDSKGRPFSGTFKAYIDNSGNFGGWDWFPAEGYLPREPEALQPIIDYVGEEYDL